MKVDDLSIGSAVVLGYRYIGSTYRSPLYWVKISNDNRFMAEHGYRYHFDEREPSNELKAMRERGNNLFPYSSLCQWLNADQESGWFVPAGEGDTCQIEQERGFLSMFTYEQRDLMLPQHVVTVVPESLKKRYGETIEKDMLVTLLSASELFDGLGDSREGAYNQDVMQFLAGRHEFWTRTASGSSVLCRPQRANALRPKSPTESMGIYPVIRLNGESNVAFSDTHYIYQRQMKVYEYAESDTEFINSLYELLAV